MNRLAVSAAYAGACVTLAALVALAIAWEAWLAPLRLGGSWLVLKALPLIAALPGIVKRRRYTYQWLSLLVWLYACEGVVRGMSDRAAASRSFGWIEAALAVMLFGFAAAFVRLVSPSRSPG